MDQDETLQILRTNLRNAEATFGKKSVQYELVLRLVAEYIARWKANQATGDDKMQIDTATVVPADDQERLMAMLQDLNISGTK